MAPTSEHPPAAAPFPADAWHLLRNSRAMARAIADVTDEDPAAVRRRLWREFVFRGSTVRRDARALGAKQYVFDDAMGRFYSTSDAFLYELAIWNISLLKRSMRAWVSRWITGVVGKQRAVLCLGDGLGFDALSLAQAGHHVTYFELPGYTSTFAARMLASAGSGVRVVSSPDELQGQNFDAVVCLDVLEHVPDVPAELARIHGYLKPGGILAVHAPFYFVHRAAVTHLKSNRKYSGSLAVFRKAGFALKDGQPTWAPLMLARNDGPSVRRPLLAWPRLALALPYGLFLSIGRVTALPFELVNLVCRLAQPWFVDDMLLRGASRARATRDQAARTGSA